MVARLVEVEDPLVRVAVVMSRHVDAGTRDRLYALLEAGAAEGDIWADVALHWNTAEPDWLREAPLDERMTYLDCPHPVFRGVLATCRDLPDEAWRRLDDDPEVSVRRAAAQRPDAPPEVLERLARAHGEAHHVRPLLVDHPRFPRHLLRTFVDEPEAHVRYMALEDPELPVAGLRRLAADTEAFVRRGRPGIRASRKPCWNGCCRTRIPRSPTTPPPTPCCGPPGWSASSPTPGCEGQGQGVVPVRTEAPVRLRRGRRWR